MTQREIAITACGISKCYRVFDNQRARLRHALWPASGTGLKEIWALRDIDFEVRRGESVGIIGRNGSGKSTLLEIVTGTLTPTSGRVQVNGRIAALLELGSGFNPQYTGRENVILNGMLFGLTREQVEDRFDRIAAFADIGDVLDQPVKTYSSGMLVRLAFSVQVAVDPDILVVDEALSVGDFFFQQKCLGRLRRMQDEGLTLLLVSHHMGTVADICSRVLYLRQGVMRQFAHKGAAIRAYLSEQLDLAADAPALATADQVGGGAGHDALIPGDVLWRNSRTGLEVAGGIAAVCILDGAGRAATSVPMGGTLRVEVYYYPDPSLAGHIYLTLRNRYDEVVFATSTYHQDLELAPLPGGTIGVAQFDMVFDLEAGEYSLSAALGQPLPPNRIKRVLDRSAQLGPITVQLDYEQDKAPFLGHYGLRIAVRLGVRDGLHLKDTTETRPYAVL